MHGWQSESIDGPEGGWSELFFLEWLQWLIHPQLLNVVWRGVAWCSVVVAVVVAVVAA